MLYFSFTPVSFSACLSLNKDISNCFIGENSILVLFFFVNKYVH